MTPIALKNPRKKLTSKNRNPNRSTNANLKCESQLQPSTIGAGVAMAPRSRKSPRLRMAKEQTRGVPLETKMPRRNKVTLLRTDTALVSLHSGRHHTDKNRY